MRHYYVVHWNWKAMDMALAPFITSEDHGAIAVELEDRAGFEPASLTWGADRHNDVTFRFGGKIIAKAVRHTFQEIGAFV